MASLPVRERGSKHRSAEGVVEVVLRRSPCGSVDRNTSGFSPSADGSQVAPRAGAWIETCGALWRSPSGRSRSPCGSVDRNCVLSWFGWRSPWSLPVRERGSKRGDLAPHRVHRAVAPRAGAWIETDRIRPWTIRGIVAPRAGAWIETGCYRHPARRADVAPRAGAWIETCRLAAMTAIPGRSLPVRERGSKLDANGDPVTSRKSLPVRERGSKHPRRDRDEHARALSLPVRERGSKQAGGGIRLHHARSLPVRERGSKLVDVGRVDAQPRRSPCGSVDRNYALAALLIAASCRSPCGSVDRNARAVETVAGISCRSLCGSVDRNLRKPGKRGAP